MCGCSQCIDHAAAQHRARPSCVNLRRMRAFYVTALLVTWALTSCERSRTNGSISPPTEALTTQALPALPLQIDLPNGAILHSTPRGVSIVLHPKQRSSLGITIGCDDTSGSFLGTKTKTRALTPLLQLTYRYEILPVEGSGGDEHVLDGLLMLASKTYRITCSQQSELGLAAEACLPILATLRPFAQDE